ncbi:MAG: hypothetical protein V4493_11195 [Pseudomonadota bacterium]
MTLSEHEIDEILYFAIFANTGAYLLRKLRQNASVQRLARELSVGSIESLANRIFSSKLDTNLDLAFAYSILGAISFHGIKERTLILKVCRPEKINLGAQIVAEMQAYYPNVHVAKGRLASTVLVQRSANIPVSISLANSLPSVKRIETSNTSPPSSVSLSKF